jgi:hypothetical protein
MPAAAHVAIEGSEIRGASFPRFAWLNAGTEAENIDHMTNLFIDYDVKPC